MKRCLVTQAYFDANEELIRGLASQAGIGNYQPTMEGELVSCRGIDPVDLPSADVFTLPTPEIDEDSAAYEARISAGINGAYHAVINGPKEVFFLEDEQHIMSCRRSGKSNGNWPQPPSE